MLNVLFITADQWRGDCLSALGHPCLRTPHLDRLAESGVLFTRHFSQATPCSPGRASLYTGLYLHNHRVVVNGTPLEARKLGYEPLLFGYTDTGVDPRSRAPGDPDLLRTYGGVLPGMTPVVPMDDDHWPWRRHLARRGYVAPENTAALFAPGHDDRTPGQVISAAASAYPVKDGPVGFLTEKVIEHLSAQGQEPWFVHLSYLAPHPPFIASAPCNTMYVPATRHCRCEHPRRSRKRDSTPILPGTSITSAGRASPTTTIRATTSHSVTVTSARRVPTTTR